MHNASSHRYPGFPETLCTEIAFPMPEAVTAAEELTPYAVEARYPGMNGGINPDEVDRALDLADTVFAWAEKSVGMVEK